ncbi:MAG TPA: hypothetical protein VJ779_11175 [Acetobacteraceae bacterium]|nr:hypothetical protein [Acetobacteraceae bacterium]
MSNTVQHTSPDGSVEPVTPINNRTLYGGAGLYSVHANGLFFIANATDDVNFAPGSNFNVVFQPQGGNVELGGSWNLAIAQSGTFYATDARAGDTHNTFVVGAGVSALQAVLQPSDQVLLAGVTQQDISAAFASLAEHPQPGYAETVSIPRASGGPLTLVLPDHFNAPPSAAQFHPLGM